MHGWVVRGVGLLAVAVDPLVTVRHHEVLLQVYWHSPDLLFKQHQVRASCDRHSTRLVRLALVQRGFSDIGQVQGHSAQEVLQISGAVSEVGGNESCGAAVVAALTCDDD